MTTSAFALRSFNGAPKRFFRVESETLDQAKPVAKKKPSHHIIVVDRSGSMYGDMDPMKLMIEKLLTVEEYNDPSLRVSLISYSSRGDVTLHFQHVTVGEVMKAGSKELKAIRSLRATALTCISQGLEMARSIVDNSEVTCVSLHTDGYANDSSPAAESREISKIVQNFRDNHPCAFVNTISYRGGDFTLLSGIANALSGACIQARDVRQVQDALDGAMKLLLGSMAPVFDLELGGATYQTFVSRSAGKILGSASHLTVQGLAEKDDKTRHRYYEITEAEYAKLPEQPIPHEAILCFARAQISEGNLNAAKYALVSLKNYTMLRAHAQALTSSAIAAMATGLEFATFQATTRLAVAGEYGLGFSGPSVLDVLTLLDKHAKSLTVNLHFLKAGYKRRGVKRIPGTREEGEERVKLPKYESILTDPQEWVQVNGFELNRNTATANMLISQPIAVVKRSDGNSGRPILEVAGVKLDKLRSYNNYTLVSDGELNVQQLMFRTNDKRCFRELQKLNAVAVTDEYEPNKPFAILFSDMPLISYDTTFNVANLKSSYGGLLQATVLQKLLSSIFPGESTSLTGEQIAALKEHYLTPALYFSPPTTTEYADLDKAIAEGKIDSRPSFKIDIGTPTIRSATELYSGNAYLQRRFTLEVDGKEVEKPTLAHLGNPKAKWGVKKLSARTKLDEIDALTYPIYQAVLQGYKPESGSAWAWLVEDAQIALRLIDREEQIAKISDLLKSIGNVIESYYDRVRPLAFYVGATGLVPDELGATMLTAEHFVEKFPEAKLSKKEKEEGTFFLLPSGLVITVYVESVYYSTGA